jgi:nicotinamidase-related amidase
MDKFFINKDDSVLVIIDIQDRLASVMDVRDQVILNCSHLIELSRIMDIPIVLTEQYPRGLGQTVKEIRDILPVYKPIEKLSFDCCDERPFLEEIKGLQRKNIILTGMETHICVLQTCLSLLKEGYNVHVVKDAVSSRKKENWMAGLEFMRQAGSVITCTETVLFQILKIAGTEEFKAISKRIK